MKWNKKYRRLGGLLVLILIAVFQDLSAQKAEVMLIKHSPGKIEAEPGISDEYFNRISDKVIIDQHDTLIIYLEYDKKFNLFLENYRKSPSLRDNDPLISLYINSVPVIVVHAGIEEGDHNWSFNTGIDKPSLRIVGGTSVSIQDYPWQVFIRAGDYLCGGSIIADKWVLTAAHCLFDEENNLIPDDEISFLAGAERPFDSIPDGVMNEVKYSVIHEDYDPVDFENDLALLRTENIIEHPFARPLNLVTEEEIDAGITDPGNEAIITGWGLTSVEPLQFPESLQELELPIVSIPLAETVWGPIPDNFLMAGFLNGAGDACSGDSGGPLIVRSGNEYKLAGVISWGSSGCNSVGGYVRISNYLNWLKKNTGIGQNEFTTIRPTGPDFRCENSVITPEEMVYVSDSLENAISYEWKIEPGIAGTLSASGTSAEVDWSEDFAGEAYISSRALTPKGYTNWGGQRVFTSPLTKVISQTGDTSVCTGSILNLTVHAEGSDLLYNWFRNGSLVKTGTEPFLLLNERNHGIELVYYTEISGSCGRAVSEPMDVEVLPLTRILSIPGNITVRHGRELELPVESTGHELNFLWFKGEEIIEGNFGNTLLLEDSDANTSGLYSVRVEGTCGTLTSEPVYVFVDPGIPQFPKGINVWPTVTTGIVNIAIEDDALFDVYIYDSNGKRTGTSTFNRYNAALDLTGLSPDIYILNIRSDDYSEMIKIIKY